MLSQISKNQVESQPAYKEIMRAKAHADWNALYPLYFLLIVGYVYLIYMMIMNLKEYITNQCMTAAQEE